MKYRTSEHGKNKRKEQSVRRRERSADLEGKEYTHKPRNPKLILLNKEIKALKRIASKVKRAQLSKLPWNGKSVSDADKYKIRYNLDPEFNLKERLRRQLRKKQKRDGISTLIRSAIERNGNSNTVKKILGWSIPDLVSSFNNLFKDGMGWHNMSEWHIDHIKPQCLFNMSNDDEYKECWSIDNLQPLWARDNLIKSNSYENKKATFK